MSIPYEKHGRLKQKGRTRTALVEATRRLLAAGQTPTIEEAAAAASISRATAYRYFPNQRELLLACYPQLGTESLLPEKAPAAVEDRLTIAVTRLTGLVVAHEAELRAMLRLALDHQPSPEEAPLRQGRAIRWLEDALAPLAGELSPSQLRRLVLAIRSATGIEALVWLVDVAGVSRHEATQIMRWTASALLAAARRGSPPIPSRRRVSGRPHA